MIKNLLFLVLGFGVLIGYIPGAQAQYAVKDSFYFMKDDNFFSDDEKDEEAQYIYERCEANPFQKVFYDCSCIAGAFRNERDKEQLVPQSQIFNSLFENKEIGCVNTVEIAGDTFQFCSDFMFYSRPNMKEEEREKYCGCVANRTATNYKKDPELSPQHIQKIRGDALLSCDTQS
ncbi:MAG TPA: hypothetical protein PLK85_00545 [Alphaproteobacteria bacterium]|nr:hypothetical protein [Alphaproteobacteria bacterium]